MRPAKQPIKIGANIRKIDNPESNICTIVHYNANNDKITIPKLRDNCLGNQIITRKALRRHFNIELSSRILGDCVSEDNLMHYKIKYSVGTSKCPKNIIINPCFTKDNVIPIPACEECSRENSSRFQSRPRSGTRRIFTRSEGNSLSTCPMDRIPFLRSPIHNKSKIDILEPRFALFLNSDGQHNHKVMPVFCTNRTTSDTSSNAQSFKQDSIKTQHEIVCAKFMDLRYIDDTTET
jgi:hypothetical protein